MEVKVDLHLHTTVSDGRLTPSELVKYTAAQGLEVIAVSDHDITDGLDEAYATVQEYPEMTIIPAIELSTEVPDDEVHMLGYFIDYDDREFQNILDKFREGRLDRGQLMVNKLSEYGMNIEWERVLEIAGEGSVGRPHVALALVEKGYFKEPRDAFDEYLCNGGLAYIERKKMTPVQGIEMLSKVGGAAVIAHPARIVGLDEMLGDLKKAGLAGIEVFYAEYSAETISWLYEMSVKHDLVPCGGSDYHALGNTGEQVPGSMGPPMESVERLKAISDDIRKGPTRSSIPTS